MSSSNWKFAIVGMASLALTGLGSCTSTWQEVCSTRLPAYEQQFETAQASLRPWGILPYGDGAGRGLASAGMEMSEADRRQWADWAVDRIKQTQSYIDQLATEPSLRNVSSELSRVADELVAFNGFTSVGNARKMGLSLSRLRERVEKIRLLGCGS